MVVRSDSNIWTQHRIILFYWAHYGTSVFPTLESVTGRRYWCNPSGRGNQRCPFLMPEVLQVLHIHNKQPDPSQGVAEMQGRICLGGPTLSHCGHKSPHRNQSSPQQNSTELSFPTSSRAGRRSKIKDCIFLPFHVFVVFLDMRWVNEGLQLSDPTTWFWGDQE